jgi:hypothetical protein
MDWFERITGFKESSSGETRERLSIVLPGVNYPEGERAPAGVGKGRQRPARESRPTLVASRTGQQSPNARQRESGTCPVRRSADGSEARIAFLGKGRSSEREQARS